VQGIRREDRNYTDAQIREALTFALAVVDELAVPDDLRVAAFQAATNLRTAKQITVEAVAPGMPVMAIPRGA